jgi:hypothetical protein
MSKSSVMPWIDLLPSVASTTLQARRDQIGELMLKAAELTRQGAALASVFQRVFLGSGRQGKLVD